MVASEAMFAGSNQLAIQFFQKALGELNTSDNAAISRIQGFAGDCYFRLKDFQRAREHYLESLAVARRQSHPDLTQICRALDGVGQSETLQGNYSAASKAFREEVLFLDRIPIPNSQQQACARCALGIALTHERKFAEAAHQFDRADRIIDNSPERNKLAALKQTIEENRLNNLLLSKQDTSLLKNEP
jgi:tetratricopeptide (TPR) repeat protein